jgi:hypothetical protein
MDIPPSGTISDYCDIGIDQRIAVILPKLSFITDPEKTTDMVSLSCTNIRGEGDFRCRGQGNARLPAGTAGVFQTRKFRYGSNMEGFWPDDNCRIIARPSKNPLQLVVISFQAF